MTPLYLDPNMLDVVPLMPVIAAGFSLFFGVDPLSNCFSGIFDNFVQ